MGNMYVFELKRLLGRAGTYIFVAIMLLALGLFTAKLNFFDGSPAFEYTAEVLTLPLMLAIPLLTYASAAKDRALGFDSVLRTLGLSPVKQIAAKLLSALTVFAVSFLPMLVIPILISVQCETNLLSAYVGILGYLLFGIALVCAGVFISTLTRKPISALFLTLASSVVIYLCELVALLYYKDLNASFLTLGILVILLSVAFMAVTRTEYLWMFVLAGLEIVILIFRFAAPSALVYTASAVLELIGIRASVSGFCYGLFDITDLIRLLLFSALMISLGSISLSVRKEAPNKNGGTEI